MVDARNKIVGLGGSGELESMGDALVSTGIAVDLSKVTVNNDGDAFKSAITWRQYASELELKLVDSGFTVHSIASDDDRTDPPTQEEIDEVEDIAAPAYKPSDGEQEDAAAFEDFTVKLGEFFIGLSFELLGSFNQETKDRLVALQPNLLKYCGTEVSWPTEPQQQQ
jgi:hypothetical protein